MALFDNIKDSIFDPLDIFNEFDAGSGTNNDDEDEELETIEDRDAEIPDDPDDDQDMDPETNPGEEMETIDDEEGTEDEEEADAENEDEANEDNNENEEDPRETENAEDDANEEPEYADPGEEDEELETIDDDDETTGVDEDDGTDETEDPSGDDSDLGNDTTDENDPHKKLKELEAEIFDQLSEEEKEMKKNELKKLYILLIEKSESIFALAQEITKTDDTVKLIDYILNTLMDLKTYLGDYVSDIYDNRTYLQNNVNFQKFLTIFDSIHAIFQEIVKMDEENK